MDSFFMGEIHRQKWMMTGDNLHGHGSQKANSSCGFHRWSSPKSWFSQAKSQEIVDFPGKIVYKWWVIPPWSSHKIVVFHSYVKLPQGISFYHDYITYIWPFTDTLPIAMGMSPLYSHLTLSPSYFHCIPILFLYSHNIPCYPIKWHYYNHICILYYVSMYVCMYVCIYIYIIIHP